ncbi:methionine ABC transporter permease [Pasteurella bettyae]|uniref:ABC transporter, permease protein n=1 Tax=Pasteurella bettyae CCUG 2042 TaxID=1095749 RepID=I3D6N6_9PAST|nr:methionine ABC transporter permease [Pasteurella bettyae]EIJ67379.1 ABC transporter, permease protein [Pasteurella bettyae CCUG 2042]SUB21118.1 D-methionine transport system permease protein MetI [Pasteurella bettyae]
MWDSLLIEFQRQFTPEMWDKVLISTWETIYMTVASTLIAVIVGLPIGCFTFLTSKGNILENSRANQCLNVIINIGRSIPYIILLLLLIPVTSFLISSSLGTSAAIVSLSVAAIPFFARLTSNALFEIPPGLTETAKALGATNWQIVTKFYLPESLPTLINGITLTFVTLIGYTAMAGTQGGGGLGSLAINYGVHRGMGFVTWIATIIIVLFVILSQKLGDDFAKKVDHR